MGAHVAFGSVGIACLYGIDDRLVVTQYGTAAPSPRARQAAVENPQLLIDLHQLTRQTPIARPFTDHAVEGSVQFDMTGQIILRDHRLMLREQRLELGDAIRIHALGCAAHRDDLQPFANIQQVENVAGTARDHGDAGTGPRLHQPLPFQGDQPFPSRGPADAQPLGDFRHAKMRAGREGARQDRAAKSISHHFRQGFRPGQGFKLSRRIGMSLFIMHAGSML